MGKWKMLSLNLHVETAFRMVSGLFLALLFMVNEILAIPKFSLIKYSLIQILILDFSFQVFFFIVRRNLHVTLSL